MHEDPPIPDSNLAWKYWAFISYSSKDREFAQWLHASLETYRLPTRLIEHGSIASEKQGPPKRVKPIFWDRAEMAAHDDLGQLIKDSLRSSRFLIVLCSPNAAQSKWVNKEIEIFSQENHAGRILCVIIGGTAKEGDANYCFPAALPRKSIKAPDARPGGDGKSNTVLMLLATMLGIEFDALKQRDAQRKRRTLALWSSIVALFLCVIAWFGWQAHEESRHRIDEDEWTRIERGMTALTRKDTTGGLTHLASALRMNPANAFARDQVTFQLMDAPITLPLRVVPLPKDAAPEQVLRAVGSSEQFEVLLLPGNKQLQRATWDQATAEWGSKNTPLYSGPPPAGGDLPAPMEPAALALLKGFALERDISADQALSIEHWEGPQIRTPQGLIISTEFEHPDPSRGKITITRKQGNTEETIREMIGHPALSEHGTELAVLESFDVGNGGPAASTLTVYSLPDLKQLAEVTTDGAEHLEWVDGDRALVLRKPWETGIGEEVWTISRPDPKQSYLHRNATISLPGRWIGCDAKGLAHVSVDTDGLHWWRMLNAAGTRTSTKLPDEWVNKAPTTDKGDLRHPMVGLEMLSSSKEWRVMVKDKNAGRSEIVDEKTQRVRASVSVPIISDYDSGFFLHAFSDIPPLSAVAIERREGGAETSYQSFLFHARNGLPMYPIHRLTSEESSEDYEPGRAHPLPGSYIGHDQSGRWLFFTRLYAPKPYAQRASDADDGIAHMDRWYCVCARITDHPCPSWFIDVLELLAQARTTAAGVRVAAWQTAHANPATLWTKLAPTLANEQDPYASIVRWLITGRQGKPPVTMPDSIVPTTSRVEFQREEEEIFEPEPQPAPSTDTPIPPSNTPAPAPAPSFDSVPEGKKTDDPRYILSPFPPYRKLDVEGLPPGSPVIDPVSRQVFRIPK